MCGAAGSGRLLARRKACADGSEGKERSGNKEGYGGSRYVRNRVTGAGRPLEQRRGPSCSTRLGVAHTLSPDVRCAHPGLRSLGDVCAAPSWLRWPSTPSRGDGQPRASAVSLEEGPGLPMPSSGLWKQAQPGWRSAADMQRAEAWRAEANVQREGLGSPGPGWARELTPVADPTRSHTSRGTGRGCGSRCRARRSGRPSRACSDPRAPRRGRS